MTNHYTKLHPAHDPGHAANLFVCLQVDEWLVYDVLDNMQLPRQRVGDAHQGIHTEVKNSIFTAALRSFRSETELLALDGYPHVECPYIGAAEAARLPGQE